MTSTTFSLRDLGISPGQSRHDEMDVALPPYVQGAIEFGDDTGGGKAPKSQQPGPPPGIAYGVAGDTVAVQLDTTAMTEGTSFRLRFEADYSGPCARCLEPATLHIDVDAHEVHDHDAPVEDEDLRSEHVDEQALLLDISAWAQEAVGLRFPTRVLCRPDCRGLCPVCGVDLNEHPDHAHEQPVDTRWDALKGLQLPEE
ncbi:MAG: hypothetical protein JWM98_3319 [Thermoleophilia bacterium]|nr:hypothetical protein [Thermoleophilia bacterium]